MSSEICPFDKLRRAFADGGAVYPERLQGSRRAGDKVRRALTKIGTCVIEIIKQSDRAKGFEILPRRWVVECTFAWLNRNRRLAKDFERTIESATAWPYLASVQLITRRITGL